MSPTTARLTHRQALRRQQILTAAAEVFAREGYAQATLEEIGDEVGLSKTSLYYYVASKEDLLASLVVQAIEAIEAAFEAAGAPDGGAAAKLEAFVRAHVDVALTPTGEVICQNLDFVFRDQPNTDMVAGRRRHQRRLRSILEEGIAAGQFRPVDTRTTTALVLAALNTVPLWARTADRRETIAGQAVELILRGLLASPPQSGPVP